MRVIVPAVPGMLKPEVVPAILETHGCEVVPMLYPESYFYLMRDLWSAERTFCIVEQDIVVDPAHHLKSFDNCPEIWCAASYEVYQGDIADAYGYAGALGCTRFRAELIRRYPEAIAEAGKMDMHPVHPPRSWAVMDSTLAQYLHGPHQLTPHRHYPNVTHLHVYDRENAYHPPAEVASAP
jgi:hypothetical protein